MTRPRIAVVGAGPAGLFAAQFLLAREPEARVDLFEKDATPWGLVRHGVAPDHQNIKSVTRVFGANKKCAVDTVRVVLDHLTSPTAAGRRTGLSEVDTAETLAARGIEVVDAAAWANIDRAEVLAGAAQRRPRVKLVRTAELLAAANGG
jgi:NADPH-dependent glutamate synthase beta subunit-like oxidoreductase